MYQVVSTASATEPLLVLNPALIQVEVLLKLLLWYRSLRSPEME
jgi:hypothetical protein